MTAAVYESIGAGRGSDPSLLSDELLWYIRDAIAHAPRSLQTRIGPSEIGAPCSRRLAYKIAGAAEMNTSENTPWLPVIGTAVHAWLAHVFERSTHGADERFLVEHKVDAGQLNGDALEGSCDLYDTITATVIDWKIVGATTLRKARASGPGDQYRAQAHTYGRGFARQGLPVDRVMIAYLPRNEELTKSFFWSEPYDEAVSLAAINRVAGIALAIEHVGLAGALDLLPTADAYCHRCPFFRAGSIDPIAGCPGHARPAPTPDGPVFGHVLERTTP